MVNVFCFADSVARKGYFRDMKILSFGIFATLLCPVHGSTIGGEIAAWFSLPDSGLSATCFENGITFDIANVNNPGGGSQQALCTANCEFSAWDQFPDPLPALHDAGDCRCRHRNISAGGSGVGRVAGAQAIPLITACRAFRERSGSSRRTGQ